MMYRNKKILRLANEIPHCTNCLKPNENDVVAAHANWQKYGKGTSLKAHDWAIAYLCHGCHTLLDAGDMPREAQIAMWEEAHIYTIGWLFDSGHLEVI